VPLAFQLRVADEAAPQGMGASNGLEMVMP